MSARFTHCAVVVAAGGLTHRDEHAADFAEDEFVVVGVHGRSLLVNIAVLKLVVLGWWFKTDNSNWRSSSACADL